MPSRLPLIFIVEDDASVRRALRRLLQSAGYSVETFASGAEFLDSPVIGRPICLVLDIQLGDMTGFEVQGRLAGDRATVPIIFITAHDDVATRERVRQSGVTQYLRKPFEKSALLGAIRTAALGEDGGGGP